MPNFKKGGTGYMEIPLGGEHLNQSERDEQQAVHGGFSAPGFPDVQVHESDENPDPDLGPQSY